VHELVAVPVDGSAAADPDRVRVLVTGPDFVHSPAAADGRLAWLQWHHPDMPWDATELLVGRLVRDTTGAPAEVAWPVQVAGGPGESVVQPGFTASGDLVFCTDRTGWWNPWRLRADALDGDGRDGGTWDVAGARARSEPLLVGGGVPAEIGGPLWVGGLRWWAEVDPGRFVVAVTGDGATGLAVVAPDGSLTPLDLDVTEVSQVVAGTAPGTAVVVAASPVREPLPYRLTLGPSTGSDRNATGNATGITADLAPLRPPRDLGLDASWIAVPRHLSFPSAHGRTAHVLFYPPTNPDVAGPGGELPPLVVTIHGGPTSAARHRLDLAKQFWTSRGIAVADVNHGGSTGYGRPFRDLLRGGWGVVDVQDAVAAARHLADAGLVDPARLAIRGGSAGGFTTLAALCFHDTFAAGTSLYGVADLAVLAQDTHKFESRYLDGLVGPWPEAAPTYAERSPIAHTGGFDRPLLLLHGREDAVVPPAQAEVVVAALAERRVPHAYLLFDGEQHGFRRADTLVRALEAELWFYGRVFGFTPADPVSPVPGAVGL
jgi:dipeptidyl aminopeptidase/acylaminoacyl peptidase